MNSKPFSKDEQTKMERAYEQEKDLASILHQVVSDLKEENHQSIYKAWGIPPKANVWPNIKVSNNEGEGLCVLLQVDEIKGGYRVPQENPHLLQEKLKDTKKLLEDFEKQLKKEFKERTGKTLRFSRGKIKLDYALIALNGLYRFHAMKYAEVKTTLDGQSWPENEDERKESELED